MKKKLIIISVIVLFFIILISQIIKLKTERDLYARLSTSLVQRLDEYINCHIIQSRMLINIYEIVPQYLRSREFEKALEECKTKILDLEFDLIFIRFLRDKLMSKYATDKFYYLRAGSKIK